MLVSPYVHLLLHKIFMKGMARISGFLSYITLNGSCQIGIFSYLQHCMIGREKHCLHATVDLGIELVNLRLILN